MAVRSITIHCDEDTFLKKDACPFSWREIMELGLEMACKSSNQEAARNGDAEYGPKFAKCAEENEKNIQRILAENFKKNEDKA